MPEIHQEKFNLLEESPLTEDENDESRGTECDPEPCQVFPDIRYVHDEPRFDE